MRCVDGGGLQSHFHVKPDVKLSWGCEKNSYSHPNKQSPESLHRNGDVGGDGVSQGEVEHKVVNIGPAPHISSGRLLPCCHQGNGVQQYSN